LVPTGEYDRQGSGGNKIKRWDQVTDERKKKCACPIYGAGTFPGEGFQRKPTQKKSFDAARAVVLTWLQAGDTSVAADDDQRIPISKAIANYLASVRDANVDIDCGKEPTSTVKKCQTLSFRRSAMTRASDLSKNLVRDGYRAVFAWAELDSSVMDKAVYLLTKRDGMPLTEKDGPFQLVVPGEKRGARWVGQVRALRILQAN